MHTNWSRLLIDPTVGIASDRLVPMRFSNGDLVSWNKNGFDLKERIEFYYLWHKILAEMIWFLDPQLIIAIKSHEFEGASASQGL
jgi:hypothetical protein